MDIFEQKAITPRSITEAYMPLISKEHIYELDLSGIRCIAYLNANGTDLRNERNEPLLDRFPELKDLHLNVNESCILDGELVIYSNGTISHSLMNRRLCMSPTYKDTDFWLPRVSYIAYDILYYKHTDITSLALYERKIILENVVNECMDLSILSYSTDKGNELYSLAMMEQLTGIVAKAKDASYYSSEALDWLRIPTKRTELFSICGYESCKDHVLKLVLGQRKNHLLTYRGKMDCADSQDFLAKLADLPTSECPLQLFPSNLMDGITWIRPELFCEVEYIPNRKGTYSHPVCKRIFSEDHVIKQSLYHV